ncbi:MAG: pyridoxal 5'-phosphate synthase glutaminase subunit PdxT [Trueperaceae bacterium]|nr:MAG: pyridoxal 5'-phosphate synthase glutaminase subunit PdxT [Trueperaceae bacterium]
MPPMRVGVLALQGAFREHKLAFERLGASVTEVRLPEQLEGLLGIVIPGGESTTMAKLMKIYGLDRALTDFYRGGGALWGTCAGAIAVSSEIVDFPDQPRLGLMPISVARNAYGRQVDSFEVDLEIADFVTPFRAIFIRAPRIVGIAPSVRVVASYAGAPVMVRQGRIMATVFHPELSGDDRIHGYFLDRLCSVESQYQPASQ